MTAEVNDKLSGKRRVQHALVKAFYVASERIGKLTIYDINKARGLKYKRKIRYCSDERLYLNLCYKEDGGTEKRPVLFYIHGGGFVSGRPEFREAFVSKFAEAGYFTVNVFYGLTPKYVHPYSIENIYKALKWVQENADGYNLDLSRVFVSGESAGATLAAMAGAVSSNPDYKRLFNLDYASRDFKFKGMVLNCGVYDMEKVCASGFPHIDYFVEAYYGRSIETVDKESINFVSMSPYRFITPDFPPSFIITAENDKLTDGGNEFAERLKENGVKIDVFHGEGKTAVHAFAVAQILKISRAAVKQSIKFTDDIP
ncbi:MAG: alpha/beta hydrolase [Clostridiaceae bacterium]|jgi:acetyl esterase/lipase|nr:alpha/beta hydrolase [Clostridiaceae bacterium]